MTHAGGRPSKYRVEYCQEAIDFMKQGYSKEAFAGHIGTTKPAIYRWIKKHKEFRNAIKRAEVACQEFWESLGIELVLAGQGNATAWIFNMKNRFRKSGWSDTTQIEKTVYRPKTLLHALPHNHGDRKAVETKQTN